MIELGKEDEMDPAFATPVTDDGTVLSGPFRSPRNMLAEQAYGGHASIHDDSTAQKMGFKSATIEGPTHFSQFVPLGFAVWGDRFLREGCLSVAYKTACHDDEQVQAFLTKPMAGETQVEIWMTRADGAEVLRGTASVGSKGPPSALSAKLAALPPADPMRVIHRDVSPGDKRERLAVRLGTNDVMGELYPFSLRQKLTAITEPSPLYEEGGDDRFGGPVIPFEMVSVLLHHRAATDPWLGKAPTIDLFVDQEISMIDGPLMVGVDYEIERTIVALSGSRRTESTWIRTDVFKPGESKLLASMLLNLASFKESYPAYDEIAAQIRAAAA
jgi:hypothetical protein